MVLGWVLNIFLIILSDVIGFYVIMFKQMDNLGDVYIFIFDMVLIDVGNGYNRYMGVFIVFVGGFYVFIWFLCLIGNEYYSVQLYVNNVVCGLVYFNVSEGGNEIVSGISVVFFNMGDNVFI